MNRKNQVKICENCTHCKQDINRGIICGLTNEYATFEAGARSSTQTIPISQNGAPGKTRRQTTAPIILGIFP